MAASRLGIPGPSSSKMRRKPTPRSASVGCAIRRPRLAYLTTLRASSEVTVASRVTAMMRKPRPAARLRTSPRATAMSCSGSRALDLLCKGSCPPEARVLLVLVHGELAPQKPDALVHVQDGVHAAQQIGRAPGRE